MCVCVCVCIYMYIYIHIYLTIYLYLYLYIIHVCVCTYRHIYINTGAVYVQMDMDIDIETIKVYIYKERMAWSGIVWRERVRGLTRKPVGSPRVDSQVRLVVGVRVLCISTEVYSRELPLGSKAIFGSVPCACVLVCSLYDKPSVDALAYLLSEVKVLGLTPKYCIYTHTHTYIYVYISIYLYIHTYI